MCYSDGKSLNTGIEENGCLNLKKLISEPTEENCGISSKAYSIGSQFSDAGNEEVSADTIFQEIINQLY